MGPMTFEQMRGYVHHHCGEAHAHWCQKFPFTCDGECTATATFPTLDGQEITATAVLRHNAHWPTVTFTLPDGRNTNIIDPRQVSGDTWHAIHARISSWGDIPDPMRRPAPPKETSR